MHGVFGIARRRASREPLSRWKAEFERIAPNGACSVFDSPDAALFTLPIAASRLSPAVTRRGEPIVACGRIHNRATLAAELGINAAAIDDEALLVRAYQRWGADCCKKIYGNWCLAAWDERRRELFLARDHHGNSALYYHVTDDAVAFATSLPLLLSLKLGPVVLNQLYLAQVLVAWPAFHSEGTALTPIKRIPPAHFGVIAPDAVRSHRYWRLEDVEPLRLAKRNDYAAGFRDVFDRAVGESLPTAGTPAITLSGGLDSGAVTVTSARMIALDGRRLAAYVAVPVADYRPYISKNRIGDEQPTARITASAAENIDLIPVFGRLTPIAALRRALEIAPSPQHAAANAYWMLDLYETAAENGCPVMLTGQFGNCGVSWAGDVFSQSLRYQIHALGLREWIRRRAKQMAPPGLIRALRRPKEITRWTRTSIRQEFADDLHLFERWLADPRASPYLPPLSARSGILRPGSSSTGDTHACFGAAAGIAVTDPTADPRVLEYCFSVPDRIFIDPETGTDRWLIRAAMDGRLPDEIRLNKKRGIQAADLAPRLRACRDEVEDALDECACGPAADYIDAPHMRRAWHRIETEDNCDVWLLAVTVLMRGIMAGLFVNGIGKRW